VGQPTTHTANRHWRLARRTGKVRAPNGAIVWQNGDVRSSADDLSFCHDPAQLSALALEAGQPAAPLVLAGPVASGRRHLLEMLAQRLGQRVVELDLAGFEPTGPGLAAFVEFRQNFACKLGEDTAAALKRLLERVVQQPSAASSGRWAVGFALLTALPLLDATLAELLTVEGAALDAQRMLGAVLAAHSAQTNVLLHVLPESTLSDATAQWLLDCVAKQPKIRLAFSCAAPLASEALLGGRTGVAPVRVELGAALTLEQALARSDAAAKRLGLDEAQQRALIEQAAGEPARLGRALEARDAGAEHNVIGRAEIEAWLTEQEGDAAGLRSLLQLMAAAGREAPVLPLLAAAGSNQADAERLIDRIDEGLCGDEAPVPVFEDLAYRHPGFPGLAVYRFRNRAVRAALLEASDRAAQLAAERKLFEFLSTRLALATRSITQLFVNLTERIDFAHSAGPRQRLRVWIGEAEEPALRALLEADLKAGRVAGEALFTTAQRDQGLSAHQRLALLDASNSEPGPLSHDRRLAAAVLRTQLLCAIGRFDQALTCSAQAQALLAQSSTEPAGLRGLLFFLSANCQRRLGQLELAIESFKAAAAEAAKPQPDGNSDSHNRGVCLAEAGHCHAERGQWQPAVALLSEGIELLKRPSKDAQMPAEQIAHLEKNLAVCQAKLAAQPGA
jgi:hypothetical protein